MILLLCCFECAQCLKLVAEDSKKDSEVKTVAVDNIISIIKNKTEDWHKAEEEKGRTRLDREINDDLQPFLDLGGMNNPVKIV